MLYWNSNSLLKPGR